jgi:hypothetical protein
MARRKPKKQDDRGSMIALVALNSPRTPKQEDVLTLLRGKYAVDPVPEASAEGGEVAMFFDLPDGMAIYSLMPGPIPWSSLEGPCQTARWWPEAEDVLRNHTFHFIVSLMGGPENPLERHIWLTKFVAAVMELSDAAGVYWGAGTVVHNPKLFCDLAEVASPDDYMPQLWIDMRLWGDEERRVYFATTGLSAFGLPEIEVEGVKWDPRELSEFCENIIRYVIGRGEPIPDGDTIGRSAKEKIKIRHAPSMWERDGPVMRLEMN